MTEQRLVDALIARSPELDGLISRTVCHKQADRHCSFTLSETCHGRSPLSDVRNATLDSKLRHNAKRGHRKWKDADR